MLKLSTEYLTLEAFGASVLAQNGTVNYTTNCLKRFKKKILF